MSAHCSAVRGFVNCRAGAANGGKLRCCFCARRGISAPLVIGLILSGITPVFGQEWRVQPSVTVGLVFNDNIDLTEADPKSSTGTSVGFAVRAERSTERASLGLLGALSWTTSSSDEQSDTPTGLLGFDLGYLTERSRFGLNTSFSTQSTRTSEETTTGLTDANGQQYRLNISPSWSYLLSDRASIDLSFSSDYVFYDNVEGSGLSDYGTTVVSLGGRYQLTERANLNARVGYGLYGASDDDGETDGISAGIGAGYAISETLFLNFLVGLQSSESTESGPNGGSVSRRSTSPTYTLSATKALARGGGFSMSATRSYAPSGTGVLDTTALNAAFRYPLSERWRLNLSGRVNRNRVPGAQQEQDSDSYAASGAVRLSYQIRESLSLQLGYRYRWQEDEQARTSADSNELSLNLAWQPF